MHAIQDISENSLLFDTAMSTAAAVAIAPHPLSILFGMSAPYITQKSDLQSMPVVTDLTKPREREVIGHAITALALSTVYVLFSLGAPTFGCGSICAETVGLMLLSIYTIQAQHIGKEFVTCLKNKKIPIRAIFNVIALKLLYILGSKTFQQSSIIAAMIFTYGIGFSIPLSYVLAIVTLSYRALQHLQSGEEQTLATRLREMLIITLVLSISLPAISMLGLEIASPILSIIIAILCSPIASLIGAISLSASANSENSCPWPQAFMVIMYFAYLYLETVLYPFGSGPGLL